MHQSGSGLRCHIPAATWDTSGQQGQQLLHGLESSSRNLSCPRFGFAIKYQVADGMKL